MPTRRRNRLPPQPESDEQPDPIVNALTSGSADPEPPADEVHKGETTGEAATGTPVAGRSTIAAATKGGPFGVLQILGPGLITGASDDDPSGIGTYSQVGSQFGYSFLWTALFTFPLMVAVQESCARIALHTGVGLGTSLRRKFPTWLVGIAILALLVANTINVGADVGAVAAGGQLLTSGGHKTGGIPAVWLVGPVTAVLLFLQFQVTYSLIFRLFKFLTLALFAYVVGAFITHPQLLELLKATVIPHFEFSTPFITAFVAILGTTISPYLFFWQASSEVDEMKAAGGATESERRGITRKELRAARTDVVVGMAFSQLVMYSIILTTAAVLNAHGITNIQTAQDAAAALKQVAGPFAFVLFSLGIIGTGLLAIPILAASGAYAVKEFFGFRGGLADKARYRPFFYGVLAFGMLGGLAMNFVGIDPIKALFATAVINGLVAPPLLILITLLGSDRKVMGEHTSGPLSKTFGWLATAVMSIAAIALVLTTIRGGG
jgi:NRAMP (natural resistance-associated macrophage protein)-like metal ion transporter